MHNWVKFYLLLCWKTMNSAKLCLIFPSQLKWIQKRRSLQLCVCNKVTVLNKQSKNQKVCKLNVKGGIRSKVPKGIMPLNSIAQNLCFMSPTQTRCEHLKQQCLKTFDLLRRRRAPKLLKKSKQIKWSSSILTRPAKEDTSAVTNLAIKAIT